MATATVTNAGLNLLRDSMRGVLNNTQILYVAVGTGSTAPAATDTQLQTEVFRKALTSSSNGAAAGEGVFTLYLSPQDVVGTAIAEVGWFAGSSATGTTNSGVLVARALYSHTKTANESINVAFDITL